MPIISEFYGIKITMFWNDNFPSHFYAEYGENKVLVDINNGTVIKGIFQQLKDIDIFTKTCTVMNDTLAWDISGKRDESNCLDLDPEQLYDSCPEVSEPRVMNT